MPRRPSDRPSSPRPNSSRPNSPRSNSPRSNSPRPNSPRSNSSQHRSHGSPAQHARDDQTPRRRSPASPTAAPPAAQSDRQQPDRQQPDRQQPDRQQPDRLQKILSRWGIASRREAESWIRAGRVRVNGQPAELGQRVDPQRDRLEIDGQPVRPSDRPAPLYLLVNKPAGMLSTCHDDRGRPVVLDLLPPHLAQGCGLHPVGRLDWDSTGALLLVNDGDITFWLTHPRFHIPKTYRVWVDGVPSADILRQWRQGVDLDGRPTRPAQVRVVRTGRGKTGGDRTCLEIILQEGRNRQIRRVAEQLGHPVQRLQRTAIGPILLHSPHHDPLPLGHYRSLDSHEISFLNSKNRHNIHQ